MKPEWELWFTSEADVGADNHAFAKVVYEVKNYTTFTPQYFVHSGEAHNCASAGVVCTDDCVHDLYCYGTTPGTQALGIQPWQIVKENLRQMCIWKDQVDYHKDGGQRFFRYLQEFLNRCFLQGTVNLECSKSVQLSVGFNSGVTEQCAAFTANDGTHPLLEAVLAKIDVYTSSETQQVVPPSLVVANGYLIDNKVRPDSLVKQLCDPRNANVFGDTAVQHPWLCKCDSVSAEEFEACMTTAEFGHQTSSCPETTGLDGITIFFIVTTVLFGLGLLWSICRNQCTRSKPRKRQHADASSGGLSAADAQSMDTSDIQLV